MNSQLPSILERCVQQFQTIATFKLEGTPAERVQQVASLFQQVKGLVTEAADAGVVDQERLERRGSWFRDAFIVADAAGDVYIGRNGRRPPPLKIRGHITPAPEAGIPSENLSHLHPNNWLPLLGSTVRHVENRAIAAINGTSSSSPSEPDTGTGLNL